MYPFSEWYGRCTLQNPEVNEEPRRQSIKERENSNMRELMSDQMIMKLGDAIGPESSV